VTDDLLMLKRRGLLSTLAAAGFVSPAAADMDVGGGDMADASNANRVKYYVGTLAERPEAGVKGRVWEVHDPGGNMHGACFYDDGSAWNGPLDERVGSLHAGDTFTERIGAGTHHYAGDYDGVDQEARLDAALSAAAEGDVIYLENTVYGDRTISTVGITLVGTGTRQDGTQIANWTLDVALISLQNVHMNGSGSVTVTGRFIRLESVNNGTITVESQEAIVMGCHSVDVTLNANTCAVGILADDSTVTDNGAGNSVGVIA
jgi:hypothetical protein